MEDRKKEEKSGWEQLRRLGFCSMKELAECLNRENPGGIITFETVKEEDLDETKGRE